MFVEASISLTIGHVCGPFCPDILFVSNVTFFISGPGVVILFLAFGDLALNAF